MGPYMKCQIIVLIKSSENISREACNDIRWRAHVVGKTR